MRGHRSFGELEEYEDDHAERPRRPAPGKVTRTMRLEGSVVPRRASGRGDEPFDMTGVAGLVERTAGGGDALPETLRGSFEESLGVRLADVRVHADGESAGAARDVQAKAFTVGQDIYFGAGQYDPSSQEGKHLLAHEVAHTAQQGAGARSVQPKLEVTRPGDAIESEADAAADAMVAGKKATVSPAGVTASRTEDPAAAPAQPVGPADSGQDATELAGHKVKVTVKVDRKAGKMEYDAKDYDELYRQVAKRADGHKCAGSCECGAADLKFSAPRQVGDKLVVDSLAITVTITVSVPTWKQLASQPKADQDKFNAWAKSVAAHEELHYKVYKDGFDKMPTVITGPTEADCDSQYDTQFAQMETDQDPIDKNQQPAALAAPGGIIKVP